ncbi:MerR family transcriptional regulator [Actinomadura sp. NPDC047616]|uniref:DNA polymerase III subunit beta family protein n=1 Tax=Actinomadura sp. NPDC047616 TaxID=3155914 RepID=UPI0033CAE729
MDDVDALLSIGAFARRVGLAPSALRFYDDCGVLRPAFVDDATGYRYYHPDQEARAVLVRRLRTAGMPLTEASVVLDGTPEEARAVLEGHARKSRETAAAAQSAIEEILRDLSAGASRTVARVGGAELSSAVRQVVPAAASPAVAEEFPILGGVLIELDGEEVRLVATDRYRLAVRTLRPHSFEGAQGQVVVDASAMKDVIPWAVRLAEVGLEVDGQTARIHGDGQSVTFPAIEGTYPDYRMILDHLPAVRNRLITGRQALRDRLADGAGDGPVTLHADDHRLVLEGCEPAAAELPAICTGPPLRIAFDPAVLLAALDVGVGPDVLLEVTSDIQPVVVRSADQGSFTTLVMPVRGTGAGDRIPPAATV